MTILINRRTVISATALTSAKLVTAAVDLRDFGAVGDGDADDTNTIKAALRKLSSTHKFRGRRILNLGPGVFKFTSTLNIPKGVTVVGEGYTSDATTPSGRAATVLLKAATGVGLTLADDCQLRDMQIEGYVENTGNGVEVIGSRVSLSRVTISRHGGVGLRIGTESPEAYNSNLWKLDTVLLLNNGSHGLYIDQLAPSQLPNFPNGVPNVNAGTAIHLDVRANAGDGIRIGNAIDCKFYSSTIQSNMGHGVRHQAYARGHQYYGLYTEANLAGELLFDNESSHNIVIGNRAVTKTSGWVDNGQSNYILQHRSDIPSWSQGRSISLVSPSADGTTAIDFFCSTKLGNSARIEASSTNENGGILKIFTKRDGDSPVARLEINENGEVAFSSGRIQIGHSNSPLLLSGVGSPEHLVAAPTGSLYMRIDGGSNTALYVKQSGAGKIGWAAK